ncbi:hypothetical protein ABGT16_04170 [Pseudomonas asiatica]|uniref:hypothetical protein n=1 Tax=Pseudomonas asiatica TaxID=2219225 RepID=UPI00345D6DE5
MQQTDAVIDVADPMALLINYGGDIQPREDENAAQRIVAHGHQLQAAGQRLKAVGLAVQS